MAAPPKSPLLTVKELASYLKISTSTVYRLLYRRQLPGFKLGSDWRFNQETVDRWRLGEHAGTRMLKGQKTGASRE